MLGVLLRRLSDLSSPDKTDSVTCVDDVDVLVVVDILIVAALFENMDENDVDDDVVGRTRAIGRRRRDRAAVADIMVEKSADLSML